jgi:aminoglycoside 6'-N-acetyltransferase
MTADGAAGGERRPVLAGAVVRLRPGGPGDAVLLHDILAEPSVFRWWGEPEPVGQIKDDLRGDGETVLLVIEVGGEVAGGIQYTEEDDPMYRHAGIDIFLGTRFQDRGAGREAVALVARFLFEERGHHRLTIDPAAANERAIRSYAAVGFRPVGVMRQYERGPDGSFHDGLLMDLLRDELTAADHHGADHHGVTAPRRRSR